MPRRVPIIVSFVLLLSTAAVAVFGVATRSAGQKELAAVLAKHAAAGYGTSVADVAAMAPPVDRDRQERLWAWMRAASPAYDVKRDHAWWYGAGAAPSEELRKMHAAYRPTIVELEALFGEGDCCLTSLGWLPEDLETATFSELLGGHIPNLLRMRHVWGWYTNETALAENPDHAVAMLQRLHESTARAGCLIDSLIAVACDAMRDDAMVLLATSDRCPGERLESWLAEAPRALEIVADGIRGERLRCAAPMAQALVDGGSVADLINEKRQLEDLQGIWNHQLRPWVEAASDCAVYLEAMVAFERYVRGEVSRDERDQCFAACENVGYPFSIMMPSMSAHMAFTAYTDRHAMVRAAVEIARTAAENGTVPSTGEEALSGLRVRTPTLRYFRLADDRFRVTTRPDDKGAPLNPKDHDAGRPLVLRHDLVEIQIR